MGKNSIVALLGDDRPWAEKLFENETWARVPARSPRPTTDYAFVARHCQTVLLTATASTFAFWTGYLSSAENVYYNKDFAKNGQLKYEVNPKDLFPPSWIWIAQNTTTLAITEGMQED